MNCILKRFCITLVFFLVFATIDESEGYAIVTGTVFCDKCKDGFISLLDVPLHGMNVALICVDSGRELTTERETTTNLLGAYAMRFHGTPDFTDCHAQVLPRITHGPNDCGAVPGPAQNLRLFFSIFGMEMYVVDPLLSQPVQANSFCLEPEAPPFVPVGSPPPLNPPSPPTRHLFPTLELSACPYKIWTMPEYHCHWKLLNPEMKVGVVFGLIATGIYGTDMNLWEALQGKADPYKTLLREATTALLNSCNFILFKYHPLGVIAEFNFALLGSNRHVLHTALKFKKANSGYGVISCKLVPCQ